MIRKAREILRHPARSPGDLLVAMAVLTGMCWAILFVVVALIYRLQLYADGAIFSYSVAVRDVWAFHWHNISGRVSVFLLSLWPAELFVALTGNPDGGIAVYGFLFYLAPLAGLAATFATDRTSDRVFFTFSCGSTALLNPLVFGFPTETWFAHTLFWPALTIAHCASNNLAGLILLSVAMTALVLTHEAALVLAFTIVLTLGFGGLRHPKLVRAVLALATALIVWAVIKIAYPPDSYFAEVIERAALHFFDPALLQVNIVLLLACVLAAYGVLFYVLSQRFSLRTAQLAATVIMLVALLVYWLKLDHWVHASNRYYLRTLLILITPLLGAAAALCALRADGSLAQSKVLSGGMRLLSSKQALRALAGAFVLVTIIYVVETAKFVVQWTEYKTSVRALAQSQASDPELGDPRFVSSQRIAPDLKELGWFSTIEYLSVVLADFAPSRLLVDPAGNYFWLSCETATANANAQRAVPAAARDLIRIYSCLHR